MSLCTLSTSKMHIFRFWNLFIFPKFTMLHITLHLKFFFWFSCFLISLFQFCSIIDLVFEFTLDSFVDTLYIAFKIWIRHFKSSNFLSSKFKTHGILDVYTPYCWLLLKIYHPLRDLLVLNPLSCLCKGNIVIIYEKHSLVL